MSRSRLADHGDWDSASVRIALVGDSTLDNVIWVGDEPSISELLAGSVPCAVKNLAADGYNSTDTLQGSSTVISVGMRRDIGDPVPWDADGKFRPLEQLAALSPAPTHIVLSVGGNDVREILSDMDQLPQIVHRFQENYPIIVERCFSVTRNVIIMLQYRPAFHMDAGGYGVYQAIGRLPGSADPVAKLNGLMENIYAPVLALARERGLPVIDLPRTFDIYRSELYEHQIEPSGKGGEVIAAIAKYVVANHDPTKASTLYNYVPCVPGAGVVTEEVNGEAPWRIPHDPSAVPGGEGKDQGIASAQEEKVLALVGMGFLRGDAEKALERHDGALQEAVRELLET